MARRVVRKPTNVIVDLDARKATILEAVVVEHIDTAQPVGSSAVAASADLDVSLGDRAFRDGRPRARGLPGPAAHVGRSRPHRQGLSLLRRPPASPASSASVQQQQVKDFFASVRGEVEDVLEQTSTLLSQMTSYTSVVVGAGHAHATILSVQLVNLDAHHHLLVTVFSDGSVVKHSVTPNFDARPTRRAWRRRAS